MSMPKPKPEKPNPLSMMPNQIGIKKIGDDDGGGPPVVTQTVIQPDDQGDAGGGPGINTSSGDPLPDLPDVAISTSPAQFDDDGDDEPSGGGSYSIGSGAPVDAFNERPGLGSSTSQSLGRGMSSSQHSAFRFNKGALVKKRKGLASR